MSDHNNVHRKQSDLPITLYVEDRGSNQHFYLTDIVWSERRDRAIARNPEFASKYYIARLVREDAPS